MKEVVYVVEHLVDDYYDGWEILLITKNCELIKEYSDRTKYIVSRFELEE